MVCAPAFKDVTESVAELLVSGVKTDAAGGVAAGKKKTREGTRLPGRVIATTGKAPTVVVSPSVCAGNNGDDRVNVPSALPNASCPSPKFRSSFPSRLKSWTTTAGVS
jgi:hypothetical protein